MGHVSVVSVVIMLVPTLLNSTNIPSLPLPTFTNACAAVRDQISTSSSPSIVLTLPPERLEPMSGDVHTHRLHLDQFSPVIRTMFELGEGMKMRYDDMPSDDDIMQVLTSIA
jgi:hypothetical protein